ncbi:MAG: ATP-binding protein, partial [Bacteroidales bacterium]|nr:ATP-binding protein [Bacteroidales bacterium]
MMAKYFNVAGPCIETEHYMIDASSRLMGIDHLIDHRQYFVIHAARQSGKTTFLLDLANRLNREGQYHALYCSLEVAQGITNPEKGIPAIISRIKSAMNDVALPFAKTFAADADFGDYANVLRSSLISFCRVLDKPLVILFDEADCLSANTL